MNKRIEQMSQKVKEGLPNLHLELAVVGLRFVDDNFRNQGWEGKTWKAVKRGGTVLIDKGTLRRGFNSNMLPGGVEIYTNVPYAKVQNEGFKGSQSVRAHQRAKFKKTSKGKRKKISTGNVKSFTRETDIKQRQFAPTNSSPSPTLDKQVTETIENFFKPILNL